MTDGLPSVSTSSTKIRAVNLPGRFTNPISHIIWSSFDYTSGPVLNLSLRFAYETSVDHASYDESTSSSFRSSTLDNGSEAGQYEDIDDVFSSRLITTLEDSLETGPPDDFLCCSEETYTSPSVASPDLKEMEESAVDSGIATNQSVHSELSQALSNSSHTFPEELTPSFSDMQAELSRICDSSETELPTMISSPPRATSVNSAKSVGSLCLPLPLESENELLSSMAGDFGVPPMSHEEYVCRHALAEQISGNFISCDPIIHKLSVVPSRRLAFGSHLFWLFPGSKDSKMVAFSILFSDSDELWYSEHQDFFDRFLSDTIMVFKAMYMGGASCQDLSDMLEKQFEELIAIIASVQPYNPRDMKLDTDLLLRNPGNISMQFLHRAICGVLMSRGHTYVYGGDDYTEILQIVSTLSLFLDEQQRRFCTLPCATNVNSYLCLQVVHEKEYQDMKQRIIECPWPACIVDMKRQRVLFSGPYWEHQKRRRSAMKAKITAILKQQPRQHKKDLSLQTVHLLPPRYASLLSQLTVSDVHVGDLITHMHCMLRNEARVFIELVRTLSMPKANCKVNPFSSKFKLSDVISSMHINSVEGLHIVLASAESQLPSISDFISQNAQLPG